MNSKYRIVYIDDDIETLISRYLSEYCEARSESLEYMEHKFDPKKGYKYLLGSKDVNEANIIFIDDRLFEDVNIVEGKISGEECKIVLKRFQPFTKTFVITQNDADKETGTLRKFAPELIDSKDYKEYYDQTIAPKIEEAVKNIKAYRKIYEKLEENKNWDNVIQERVINALLGTNRYDELSKSDIDELIKTFKTIEKNLANYE